MNSHAVFNTQKPEGGLEFILIISTRDFQTRCQIWVQMVENQIFYQYNLDVKHALKGLSSLFAILLVFISFDQFFPYDQS